MATISNAYSLEKILSDLPPGKPYQCRDAVAIDLPVLQTPAIRVHCDHADCNKLTWFDCTSDIPGSVILTRNPLHILRYQCRNCKHTNKVYALLFTSGEGRNWTVVKFGEWQAFGPPLPSRLLALAGGDRAYWIQGRICENQGLGIGAFGYYRRVVESQKNRLFDRLISVCKTLGSHGNLAAQLESAKGETQFTKAVDSIKAAMPQALLIDGHDPLKLLHVSLSEGLHALPDEACLELAASIRVVMSSLVERMESVLSDDAELKGAVKVLHGLRSGKSNAPQS